MEKKNILLFASGKFVSLFGTFVYSFAISLYILNKTGSGLSFATNLFLSMLPVVIISPIAGVLADRYNKKLIVVLMDILSGILMVILYFISINLAVIYIVTFLLTVLSVIFNVTFESSKPDLVSDEKLLSINSISKMVDSLSSVLGPIVGGIIFAFFVDIKLFILINGISFIISAFSELFIDFEYNQNEINEDYVDELEVQKSNFLSEMKEGLTYIKKSKNILTLIIVFIIINFVFSLSVLVPFPFIIVKVLELKPLYYGIIEGSIPVGMIMGALLVNKISKKPYSQLLLTLMLFLGLTIILIGIPLLITIPLLDEIYLVYYCIVMGGLGIILSLVDIPLISILQAKIEKELRGRVLSLIIGLVKIVSPLGLLISGLLLNLILPWILPVSGGIILLLLIVPLKKKNVALL